MAGIMSSFSPLNRFGAALAIYAVLSLLSLSIGSVANGPWLFAAMAPLLGVGPGAIFLYGCHLIWQTRDQECWQPYWGLPLRGPWLCAMVTAVLAVPSAFLLLAGITYSLVAGLYTLGAH